MNTLEHIRLGMEAVKIGNKIARAGNVVKGMLFEGDANYELTLPLPMYPCDKDLQDNIVTKMDVAYGIGAKDITTSSFSGKSSNKCDIAYNRYIVALKSCSKNNTRYHDCVHFKELIKADNIFIRNILTKDFSQKSDKSFDTGEGTRKSLWSYTNSMRHKR